jgi:two-component system, sensor histidine kinase PdtaS
LTTMQEIVEELVDSLLDDFKERRLNSSPTTTGCLRALAHQFGERAGRAGYSLELTLAGALEGLQQIVERTGSTTADSTTILGAGIALAAATRGHDAGSSRALTQSVQQVGGPELNVTRLQALHNLSHAASTNTSLPDLLKLAVRSVAHATNSDACAIFLYDSSTDLLALWAANGLNPASVGAMTIKPGRGITGLAAAEGRAIIAADAREHKAWISSATFGDEVYTSQASLPMLAQGPTRLIGVLNVLSFERRELDGDDIAFLQTVANEMAIIIENSRLHSRTDERLRRKITELGTLQRVSRAVASSLDLSNVLRIIAEAAVELTNAEAAAVFRLPRVGESETGDATPVIGYRVGYSRQAADESQRNDLVLRVIETGAARAANMEYLDGSTRLYCLPLRSPRETWGALCVRLPAGVELTEDELGLVQAFCDSGAIALENAQLYENERRSAVKLSVLLQEMHHRVRNNLQTVAALLSLQLRQIDSGDPANHLRDAASRVQAIASVHDLLSDESRLAGASIDAIARLVVDEVRATLVPPGLEIDFDICPCTVEVPSKQTTILALIINELISNAITHGMNGRETGWIAIRASQNGNIAIVEVENDGDPLPESFDPTQSTGLGLKIVDRLAESDLRGTFTLEPTTSGTIARVSFPVES